MHLALDFQHLFTFSALISLLTLSVLEIVLGIDNIIFISLVSGRLPKAKQKQARTIGLMLALVLRIILLFSITLIIGMTGALFHIIEISPWIVLNLPENSDLVVLWSCSSRDLILLAGGIFLLYKTTIEIRHKIEGEDEMDQPNSKKITLNSAILQIVVIDLVFSFDSILTAVGLVDNLLVMVLAVVIALLIMLIFSSMVADFVNNNPTIKMLALAFLLMIGMILIVDAFHFHVPKGYVYFSMAFSFTVELLNLRMNKKAKIRKRTASNKDSEK